MIKRPDQNGPNTIHCTTKFVKNACKQEEKPKPYVNDEETIELSVPTNLS